METLRINATEYSPEIVLDAENGILEIRGDSFPENTYDFYKPVLKWMEAYFENCSKPTTVNMEINYFNSSSSQLFFDLFDLFDEAAQRGCPIEINWIYSSKNASAKEAGEDFLEEFESFTINLVEM